MGKVKLSSKPKGKTTAAEDASEKVITNNLLNSRLPIDNKTALEILKTVSAKTGVDMPFLAANALQEGMGNVIRKGNMPHEDFMLTAGDNEAHPISGYSYYGLDTFGDMANELKSKGYIPSNMDYEEFDIQNEKGDRVKSANFKNNEDALTAKAGFIKNVRDKVRDYAKTKNLKLEDKTEKYLTMSGYNGGMGTAMHMMNELSTGKYNQKDFIEQGLTSKKQVHNNVSPRFRKMEMIDKLTSGPVAPYLKKTVANMPEFLRTFNTK